MSGEIRVPDGRIVRGGIEVDGVLIPRKEFLPRVRRRTVISGPVFYEAADDERFCGEWSGCPQVATIRIEWSDGGYASVACDEHAALARRDLGARIARLSTWVPED